MKKRFVVLFLLFAAILPAASLAQKSKSGNDGKGKIAAARNVEPTAREAIKSVLANGDILLSADETCKSVGTTAADKTISDFLIGILSFQAEPNSRNKIAFEFKPETGKKGERLWAIDLLFSGELPTGSADEPFQPWSNGFRFLMRDSDRKMIRASLQCIGTG